MTVLPLLSVDNEPTDRTDQQPSSSYLSGKDLKWIGIALVAMLLILLPVYRSMKRRADKHVCIRNFNAINQAILGYAAGHDNRLPPAFEDFGGAPLMERGGAISWITQVSPYITQRGEFACPSAEESESAQSVVQVPAVPGQGAPGEMTIAVRPTSYGMYFAYGAYAIDAVAQPAQTAFVAETTNRGARGSYDPVPLNGPDGVAPYDGPVIGWDTGNFAPEKNTKAVTRLAFYGVGDGNFRSANARSRHDAGIHVLFLDGHYETLGPTSALVAQGGGAIQGRWQVPPTLVPTR